VAVMRLTILIDAPVQQALFVRGCGRTDFQQGSASRLYHSITTRLYCLPDDTIVYPGHDYKGRMATSIGEEKRYNPRLTKVRLVARIEDARRWVHRIRSPNGPYFPPSTIHLGRATWIGALTSCRGRQGPEEFEKIMAGLNLAYPKKIDQALPYNIVDGDPTLVQHKEPAPAEASA
jgi:hypothetical protein